MVKIYGIKNCDTMKKAMAWLDQHKIAYEFHDYKKSGADEAALKTAIAQNGWENTINRRGTTWRALPDKVKEGMTETSAKKAAIENPSLIKRPLLMKDGTSHLGFSPDEYKKIFK